MKKLIMTSGAAALILAAIIFLPKERATAQARVSSTQPPTDTSCIVQLRRDALGGSLGVVVPPLTTSVGGSDISLSGRIRVLNSEWLLLDSPRGEVWIPRSAILLIVVQGARPAGAQ
jgi:hypothetical protein